MRMTLHEIVLISTVVAIIVVGAGVKYFRDSQRMKQRTVAAETTPKPAPQRPAYLPAKKR